jgi:diacylglycerol kinase (ATP)
MPRRALLLINPKARLGGDCDNTFREQLQQAGLEVICDKHDNESISQAIVRHRGDIDLVIVGGGDGTLNDAIAGLIETRLPLGIIPLGTANDLARTLELPTDPAAACDVIIHGAPKAIDVGEANGHCFFNVASLGLSVDITLGLDAEAKRRYGVFAYLFTAFQTTFRVRPFHAEIRTPTETFRVHTVQIAVGNGRYYGGGMTVAEDATIDDGLLDLYSVEVNHWWKVFWLTPAIMRGQQERAAWIRTLRSTSFEVITRRRRAVNTDGELSTYAPVKFRVLPKAVQVIVPITAPANGQAPA